MKKNKNVETRNIRQLIDKKKFLLLAIIWAAWFFPCLYLDINAYPHEKLIQGSFVIGVMVASTILYYFLKNIIVRICILAVSVIALVLFLEINVALNFCSGLFLIFVYIISSGKTKFTSLEKTMRMLLVIIAPVLSIGCMVLNVDSTVELFHFLDKFVFRCLLFIAALIYVSRCKHIKEIKKNQKAMYVFSILTLLTGFVASVFTFDVVLNYSVGFFPWFFLVTVMIFEEDKILESSAAMLTEKVKKFLDVKINN
ncbi:MAG: hypothetical protein IJ025_05565 [Clostridia bacterium]|nr:hypothetical protein [Clostridia bacterium]